LQSRLQGDDVYRLAVVEEVGHRPVQHLMLWAVEILRIQNVHHPRNRLAFHEHRAQSRLLGL